MTRAIIRFPWCLLIHLEDEMSVIVSAGNYDMVVNFTDAEFAGPYGERSESPCQILEISEPASMVDFFEQVIEAEALADDRPISHACFDPIEPSGGSDVSSFEIESHLEALKRAMS